MEHVDHFSGKIIEVSVLFFIGFCLLFSLLFITILFYWVSTLTLMHHKSYFNTALILHLVNYPGGTTDMITSHDDIKITEQTLPDKTRENKNGKEN